MSSLSKYLDKDNLHHAYLIEGNKEEITSEILELFKNEEIVQITLDTIKIEDARNIKSLGSEKSHSGGKKIFLITTNSILREAQNTMLKLFEEPIADTHFFLVMPDTSPLLRTFRSRFFAISAKGEETMLKEAEKFIALPIPKRIDFIKELLEEPEEENLAEDSARAKAIKFLNSLESELHRVTLCKVIPSHIGSPYVNCFEQIFKARQFLRQPGSSTKSLMESVALITPLII
jgi:DNA polymerase III delta prime subunit